jgi:hypothetical protein
MIKSEIIKQNIKKKEIKIKVKKYFYDIKEKDILKNF